MNHRDTIQGLIDLYLKAISANAPEIAPLADDATYGGPMVPDPLKGATVIRQFLGEIGPFISHIKQLQTIIEGDKAAVIIEIGGLRKRILHGSMFFEFENSQISTVQVYFASRLLIHDLS